MKRRTLLILAFVALSFIALPGACTSGAALANCYNVVQVTLGVADQALG